MVKLKTTSVSLGKHNYRKDDIIKCTKCNRVVVVIGWYWTNMFYRDATKKELKQFIKKEALNAD